MMRLLSPSSVKIYMGKKEDINIIRINDIELYKSFSKMREDILVNKYYLSEKAGKDVGFEKALIDWIINHRKNFFEKQGKNINEQKK